MSNAVGIRTNDTKGHVGQTIVLKAHYGYTIKNETDKKITYVGYVNLSVGTDEHIQERINFSLMPGDQLNVTNQLIYYRYKATYPVRLPFCGRIKITDSRENYESESQSELTVTLT